MTDTAKALTYYSTAYGAQVLERLEGDAGVVEVASLSVDGAEFWVQRDASSSPEAFDGGPVRMILSVEDPDAVFARAVAAGATVMAPVSEGNGWRVGRVIDPCGHQWEIGRRL